MSDPSSFEARIRLTKSVPAGQPGIVFGRYQFTAIPRAPGAESEGVLRFLNEYIVGEGNGASNPEGECELARRFLSLMVNSRTHVVGTRIAHMDIPRTGLGADYPEFAGELDRVDYSEELNTLLRLENSLARQFLRACNAYTLALTTIPGDAALAFLLLVVAGECMSSQEEVISSEELHLDKKKCERFCRFVTKYTSARARGSITDDELFTKLLKTAYYAHRSAFAHGGREVSAAADAADKLGQPYFKNYPEGKETLTPGLRWFSSVVRDALLGFLRQFPPARDTPDEALLGRIGLEMVTLNVKAARAVAKGEPVTGADIETL